MAIIGNINGWSLLAMPGTPGARQVDWSLTDAVGQVSNPYTYRQQFQDWQAGLIEATVTMPPLTRSQAGAWLAFLAEARGPNCVFYFADGLATQPQGTAEGAGVINGIFQGPYSLTTNGWTPDQANLLLPGDWLQVNWRMYMCLDTVASDGAGNASIGVWPQIREQPASGTAIVTANPQGLFRLSTNLRRWSESYLRTWGLSFQIREAI